jgi:predicted nucleic acid binding AN1-type Zn finger protein
MFNTKSSCSKSFVTVTDNFGNIRKTYCTSESLTLSEKVKNYTTVIQKCSLEKVPYNEFFSYMIYGSNDSSSTSIPYSNKPIRSHIIDPNNIYQ